VVAALLVVLTLVEGPLLVPPAVDVALNDPVPPVELEPEEPPVQPSAHMRSPATAPSLESESESEGNMRALWHLEPVS
jgi:hypothetical protein